MFKITFLLPYPQTGGLSIKESHKCFTFKTKMS